MILPWLHDPDNYRHECRVGSWLGIVDYYDNAPAGNWALYRDGELVAHDIAPNVDVAMLAVEDAYLETFAPVL